MVANSYEVKFLTLSNRAVLAVFGVKPTSGQEFVTREEALHTVTEGGETGASTEHEHKVIENMLDFSHTHVSEVMNHAVYIKDPLAIKP